MSGEVISRREFLASAKWIAAGVVLTALGIGLDKLKRLDRSDILSENDLIRQLSALMESQAPLTESEEHRRLIASVVYNSALYFGGDETAAIDRVNNIQRASHSGDTNCPPDSAGCSSGTKIEYIAGKMNQNAPSPAMRALITLTHEAYHSLPVSQKHVVPRTSDYGFMGSYQTRYQQGFREDEKYEGSYENPMIFDHSRNLPEEFSAQWGAYRYAGHLWKNGLKTADLENYIQTPHLSDLTLVRPVKKIESEKWQEFWGDCFTPASVDSLHLSGDRHLFMLDLGRRVNEISNQSHPHTHPDNNLAGLGLLAFRTFVLGNSRMSPHPLRILEENNLNECRETFSHLVADN